MQRRTSAVLAAIAFFTGASTAHAQFTVEGSPYATGNAPYNAYAADFNGDGRQDVATSEGDGNTVSVFLRQPAGGFVSEAGPVLYAGASSNGTVGDFNGDGRPDLAIADFVGTGVVVLLRNAAGGFAREPNVQLGGRLSAVGAGDFNGDRRTDIVVAAYDAAQVTVLLRNASNNGFTVAPSGNYAVGVQPRQFALADFDANGQLDIAVTNVGSSIVSVLLNSGGATFSSEPPAAVGAQPNGIAAGDYDGDGRMDLAVADTGGDTVSILLRSPLGGFASAIPVAVGDAPVSVASADLDANGTLDIAVTTGSSLDVVRRGAAGFSRDSTTPITPTGAGLALADFNADDRTDAAVSSLGANLLTVLLGPSPAPPPPPPQPTPTPTPTPTPPLDNPQVNREVNVLPVSGTVRIRRAGSNRYVELRAGEQIPNGSSVDAREGRVTIVAAQSGTRVERADFFDGLFRVSQTSRLTTLTLTEALDCSRGARAAQKKPKSRKLWGDGKGKFRTKGRYAAATVRGTRWLVRDTCTTTKVTVRQGSVSVRDEVRKRTIVVRKGKSYTARARR